MDSKAVQSGAHLTLFVEEKEFKFAWVGSWVGSAVAAAVETANAAMQHFHGVGKRGKIARAAENAADHAYNAAAHLGFYIHRSIFEDFQFLLSQAQLLQWTDDSRVPRKLFGTLWPRHKPAGWPAHKAISEVREHDLDLELVPTQEQVACMCRLILEIQTLQQWGATVNIGYR